VVFWVDSLVCGLWFVIILLMRNIILLVRVMVVFW